MFVLITTTLFFGLAYIVLFILKTKHFACSYYNEASSFKHECLTDTQVTSSFYGETSGFKINETMCVKPKKHYY